MQDFQQVTEDYLTFMQDLRARDGGFRATLCGGRSEDTQDDQQTQGNGNTGGSSDGVLPAASVGVLAGLCGYSRYPNGTFYRSAGAHPLDYYWNMTQDNGETNDAEREDQEYRELSCPQLAEEYSTYNVTGRKGTL